MRPGFGISWKSPALDGRVVGVVLGGELFRGAARRVLAVEAGAAEAVLGLLGGVDHRVRGEVGEGGSPDLLSYLLDGEIRADELVGAVHVYAVVARPRYGRRGDPEVDLRGACLEEQFDELAARVATHDGVVHHDDP